MIGLLELAARNRAALLRRDRAAGADLLRAYALVRRRLQADLDALTARIASARAAGETVDRAWLAREVRYRSLIAQVEAQVGQFARVAEGRIRTEQRLAALAGGEQATALISAAAGEAGIGLAFNRLPVQALSELVGVLADGSPLSSLLGQLGPQAGQAVRAALIEGVGTGLGPRQIAREVVKATDLSAVRALRIARNETLRAYRSASQETYEANADVLSGWVWWAALSKRTCPVCYAMHGTFHKLDEPFASHVACFTAGHVVSGPRAIASTVRWYKGDVIEVVTAAGNLVTVTPNHPILTPQGWVAAGLLVEGDEVIGAGGRESPLAAVNPDEHQQPALIEDVARALGSEGGVIPVRVPTTALDFHGDGVGSEVCVVRADRLLHDDVDAAFLDPGAEQLFRRRDVGLSFLARAGRSAPLFERGYPAGRGAMRGGGIAAVFFRGARGHHQAIGGGAVADWDTRREQAPADGRARDTEHVRQCLFGDTGFIQGDDPRRVQGQRRIVSAGRDSPLAQHTVDHLEGDAVLPRQRAARYPSGIRSEEVAKARRFPFTGYVYNLQTREGWYIANGIITHNCRCTQLPQTKGSRLAVTRGAEAFKRLPEEDQRAILGPGKFAAYRRGDLALDDLVAKTRDRTWGPGLRERSLRDVSALPTQPPPARAKAIPAAPRGMGGARTFERDGDAVDWAKRRWAAPKDAGTTKEQIEALRQYQSAGYQGVNPHLRGTRAFPAKRVAEMEREVIGPLDTVLAERPVPEDVIAWRGVNRDAFPEMSERLAGKVFEERGYLSTALGAKMPGAFASKDVVMRVRVPAGTPGYFMPNVATDARMRAERELLIGRGQRFVVHEAKYNGRTGKWNLDVELLGPKGKAAR